ncbi:hypothetical protein I4I73_24920 [Pseudonocardia sp. KRD-184]|uniref:Uncharacterized protein n=1 Tax=Pseudonocardia oceani TaxID=2792013 RepID=A0ABS6U450_9PSEU|nr:hypothetical protein [Pseudonocardia oceani]MBW0092245.1 hypothetical protein [Pseudonocardia oceani]MBW0099240.1 hypothetical protein [Pseudonocardia oceani]MBW0125399.1 hypothetical protein [Pseudonocardia oceani]MBW0126934.1 hypothetical protein [Pseudonocardia oceani]
MVDLDRYPIHRLDGGRGQALAAEAGRARGRAHRGRHSLHRVTPVAGGRPRINAVLAYSARPGDRLNTLTQELFYGRSA